LMDATRHGGATARALAGALALAGVGLAGCGEEFAPASEVSSLRVFAVSKDPSLARPGEEVALRMLWHEPRADRPTQIVWLADCWNPPGDLFAGCLSSLDPALEQLQPGDDRVTVPEDVISSREASADADATPYGIGFVFFAACAGTLGPAEGAAREEFPIACYDAAGGALGSEDFIVGYVAVEATEEGRNGVPALGALSIDGRTIPLDCVGDACVDDPVVEDPIDCAAGDPRCVACRRAEGEEACEALPLVSRVEVASIELDPESSALQGEDRWEQTWMRFYADDGELSGDIRIVSDAQGGPREEVSIDFTPPERSGEVRLWVTLHDNRGGATWARFRLSR
jgi:hypothetical protein